jgi:hypothetical protein
MATISNTPRPGYVWDSTDDVWYPIGTGPHTHADYITSGSAINPNVVDAKGDIIAATTADTVARLAVGANDTVLTADSSEATGLKWAAPAGGAGNMAQIATGTLSGASVQITGLTSYTDILVLFYEATNDSSNGGFRARLNSTASNHRDFGFRYTTSFGRINNGPTDYFAISNDNVLYTDNANVSAFKLTNCKNAGFTDIDIYSIYVRSGGGNGITVSKGIYTLSETVSTIDIVNTGGNWNAGTYYVWGA